MCAVGSTIAVLLTLAVGLGAASRPVPEPAERPVPRAHAHNDYQHAHPLFDALHHGFVGVEADVYLVGKALRISHDKVKDWTTVPTLEAAPAEFVESARAWNVPLGYASRPSKVPPVLIDAEPGHSQRAYDRRWR